MPQYLTHQGRGKNALELDREMRGLAGAAERPGPVVCNALTDSSFQSLGAPSLTLTEESK